MTRYVRKDATLEAVQWTGGLFFIQNYNLLI